MGTLSTCCFRVLTFLTDTVQQIHSLRARGVRSSQVARTSGLDVRAFFKSSGASCTTPLAISSLIMSLFYLKRV